MEDENHGPTLGEVVPWGRNLSEYKKMLLLGDSDLSKTFLDVGSGPSSFNAEMYALGKDSVTSVDPIYGFSTDEISGRIALAKDLVTKLMLETMDSYVWSDAMYPTLQSLVDTRIKAMQVFLKDYEFGKGSRYMQGSVLRLEYPDKHFDLALSSHFLLMYSAELGESFHRAAVTELCRVAKEVRIFPMLDINNQESALIPHVQEAAINAGMKTEIVRTQFEFQCGGHSLLRIF